MLQLVAGREPGICELQSPRQAEEVMFPEEVTGQRRHRRNNLRLGRASVARLDKLKHVLPKSAEMSLGAADTSVRATSESVTESKGELRPPLVWTS